MAPQNDLTAITIAEDAPWQAQLLLDSPAGSSAAESSDDGDASPRRGRRCRRKSTWMPSERTVDTWENLHADDKWEETPWRKPDVEIAERYRRKHSIMHGHGGLCAVGCDDFARISVGVALYFTCLKRVEISAEHNFFQLERRCICTATGPDPHSRAVRCGSLCGRYCIALFALLTVLSAPSIVLNFSGNRLSSEELDPLNTLYFSLGNFGSYKALAGACAGEGDGGGDGGGAGSAKPLNGTDMPSDVIDLFGYELEAEKAVYLVVGCDAVACVVFALFVVLLRYTIFSQSRKYDREIATPADYTVMVRGLPPDARVDEIRDHFSRLYTPFPGWRDPGSCGACCAAWFGHACGLNRGHRDAKWYARHMRVLTSTEQDEFRQRQREVLRAVYDGIRARITSKGGGGGGDSDSSGDEFDDDGNDKTTEALRSVCEAIVASGVAKHRQAGSAVDPNRPGSKGMSRSMSRAGSMRDGVGRNDSFSGLGQWTDDGPAFPERGSGGVAGLSRAMLQQAVRVFGVKLSHGETDMLMTYFDQDGDGTVDVNEFFSGVSAFADEERARRGQHQRIQKLQERFEREAAIEAAAVSESLGEEDDASAATAAKREKVAEKKLRELNAKAEAFRKRLMRVRRRFQWAVRERWPDPKQRTCATLAGVFNAVLATSAGRAKGGKGGTSPRRGGIALNESMTVLNGSKGVKKLLRKIDFADVIESGEDADVLFKYLDFDDSGHITVAEFVRGMVETDDLDRHRHRGQQRARRHAQRRVLLAEIRDQAKRTYKRYPAGHRRGMTGLH